MFRHGKTVLLTRRVDANMGLVGGPHPGPPPEQIHRIGKRDSRPRNRPYTRRATADIQSEVTPSLPGVVKAGRKRPDIHVAPRPPTASGSSTSGTREPTAPPCSTAAVKTLFADNGLADVDVEVRPFTGSAGQPDRVTRGAAGRLDRLPRVTLV